MCRKVEDLERKQQQGSKFEISDEVDKLRKFI